MKTPTTVNNLQLVGVCSTMTYAQWQIYMKGATTANHKIIDQLVKLHLPDLYNELSLDLYNPYHYFKTQTHLILVHSSIEYFLEYN